MAKFNVGDKVRRVEQPHSAFRIGYEGVVTAVHPSGIWVSVDNFNNGCDAFPLNSNFFELIEEPKVTQQFKAMKICIKDAIHSRMVQEALFEMGYGWSHYAQDIRYTDKAFIYTKNDGYLLHGSLIGCFNEDKSEEVELVTTYSFKPVDQEVLRKREEKEALERNVADMQKQLDEMKQKLEKMF